MNDKKFDLKIRDYDLDIPEKKKTYNEHLFTEVAPKYNFLTRVLSFGRDPSWKKMLINKLPSIERPKCLDIASGTGDVAFHLAEKYPKGNILGIDLNGHMINLAKRKSIFRNITFRKKDMCKTGLKSNEYDIITGGYALRNAPDLKKALSEIRRIMKKKATAGFLDFSKTPIKFIQAIQLFFLKVWGNIWGIILHGNPEVYGYIAESLKKFPDRKEMDTLLNKLKFRNIRTKKLFFGFVELIFFEK